MAPSSSCGPGPPHEHKLGRYGRLYSVAATAQVVLGVASLIGSVFSLAVFRPVAIAFAAVDGLLALTAGSLGLFCTERPSQGLLVTCGVCSAFASLFGLTPFAVVNSSLPTDRCRPTALLAYTLLTCGVLQSSAGVLQTLLTFAVDVGPFAGRRARTVSRSRAATWHA